MEGVRGALVGMTVAGLVLLAACGGGSTSAPASSPATSPATSPAGRAASPTARATAMSAPATQPALPRISLPVAAGATVEGLVDVNGHDIYARCTGQGAPTIVYFTGWAPDLSKRGVDVVRGIEDADQGRHRICSYERRNTGRSEAVPGTQSPEDVVGDVDGVLAALGEKGPFILLGASFGGLVAGAYAVAHPDRVAGVLLLDAAIPDDYLVDQHDGFEGLCAPANRDADANDSLEKVDNCRLAKWAYDRRDRQPDVPLIYLAASNPSERGNGEPGDDVDYQAFVQRWSPGVWQPVDAPHYMDEADPELVEQNIEKVLGLMQG